jgi:aminoglycoside phosphotransferase (APT) family kinase protein
MNVQEVSAEERQRDESVIRRELGHDGEIVFTDEGWDSRAYIVNHGEAVFKFPRSTQTAEQYRYEIAALRVLEGLVSPVRTPRVRWEDPDLAYFGYEGIVGEPLSSRIAGYDTQTKTNVGQALGRFVKLLHAVELPDARTTDVEAEISNYDEKYQLAKPALVAAFSESELPGIERFFLGQLPAEMRRLGGELRLSHGDLGPWNIIVSPTAEVGVIDFGDVGYQDESKDFSGFGDDTILAAALESYGADAVLREKASLRIKAFPILDIPFYLGKHNQAGVDACVDLVRRVILRREELPDARFKRD